MALKTANIPKPVKLCALTVILVLVYLVIAIPFKVMSVIPGHLLRDSGLYRLCDRQPDRRYHERQPEVVVNRGFRGEFSGAVRILCVLAMDLKRALLDEDRQKPAQADGGRHRILGDRSSHHHARGQADLSGYRFRLVRIDGDDQRNGLSAVPRHPSDDTHAGGTPC